MKKVYFDSLSGYRLCGIWHIPTTKTDKAIVLAHGLTVDKDEGGIFTKLAIEFCAAGFAVFRFDFSGHGESEGKSIDLTISAEIKDLEAAVNQALKQYPSLGLVSASFGGGPSIFYTAKNQNKLKCLCLWNPVLNYEHTFINPTLPWLHAKKAAMERELQTRGWTALGSRKFVVGKALFEEMASLKPYEALKKISIPTMIIHGDKDSKIPYEDSREYAKLLANGKLTTLAGAEHGFHEKGETPQAIKETVNFFKNNL